MKKIIAAALLFLLPSLAKADTTTTRWGLTKPDVGSTNWGPKINTNYDTIDNAAGINLANTFTSSQTFSAATSFGAQVLQSNGSQSAPAIAFTNAPTVGWYLLGTGGIGFASGSSTIFQINTSSSQIPNPLYFPNGSASAPAMSFLSDNRTGFYGDGAQSIRISINGVQQAKFSNAAFQAIVSTFQFQAADGTVSVPSYSFGSDTDTGIFDAAANILGLVAGGGNRMQVETTKIRPTVVIGGTDGSGANPAYAFNSDLTSGMYLDAGGNLSLGTTGSNALTADKTSHAVSFKGTNTNDSASAGYVGEYISSTTAALKSFPTSNQYGDLAQVTLTAGDWDVTVCINSTANGATVTDVQAGLSVNSGTSGSGLIQATNTVDAPNPSSSADAGACMSNVRVSINTPTTYYFKYLATYTVATPKALGRMSARRVR